MIQAVNRITDMWQSGKQIPFLLPHTPTLFLIKYLSVSNFSENTCLVIQAFLSNY